MCCFHHASSIGIDLYLCIFIETPLYICFKTLLGVKFVMYTSQNSRSVKNGDELQAREFASFEYKNKWNGLAGTPGQDQKSNSV